MANPYSVDDLLEFLDHTGSRGLMPAATSTALAVATRNVMGVLSDQEKLDLGSQDLDSVIKRFNNKRAKDFSPSSLKEYGRRVHRAVDLFLKWREDPSNFTVKTRATTGSRRKDKNEETEAEQEAELHSGANGPSSPGTYQSAVPIRTGVVVTIANIPYDLSKAEAERVANFVKMLAIE